MSEEDKLQKAKELVELTGRGKRMDFGMPRADMPRAEEFKTIREEQDRRLLALNVELNAKHMSNEQLEALLDFYKSDMGRSILEVNAIIAAEFRERFHETVSFTTPRKDGAAWFGIRSGNTSKRDT